MQLRGTLRQCRFDLHTGSRTSHRPENPLGKRAMARRHRPPPRHRLARKADMIHGERPAINGNRDHAKGIEGRAHRRMSSNRETTPGWAARKASRITNSRIPHGHGVTGSPATPARQRGATSSPNASVPVTLGQAVQTRIVVPTSPEPSSEQGQDPRPRFPTGVDDLA